MLIFLLNGGVGGGAAPVNGISYWDGSTWTMMPLKYWTGSDWVVKPLKRWNGSIWV